MPSHQRVKPSVILLLCLFAGAAFAEPLIQVSKSPTCGCCTEWVDHLKANGFAAEATNHHDMHSIKAAAGIPPQHASCHTAKVGNYVIEGHVPASDIKRLLEEQPDALGLSVPGMPIGSPGMEMGDRVDNYQVLLLNHDGSTEVFSRHPQPE